MDPKQVVIHFIGLVLFTTQVSNDPGLRAILPLIRHGVERPDVPVNPGEHQHAARAAALEASPIAALGTRFPNIEAHIAMLVFPRSIILDESQWRTSEILSRFPHATQLADYNFVQLTGEHIRFLTDAANVEPAVLPINMPRFSCGDLKLTSDYERPYMKAAAMVYIPQGTLSVCNAKRLASGRIDTRLILNTTNTVTILARSSAAIKRLVLKTTSEPTIYLANVPSPQIKGTHGSTAGDKHYEAYWKMIGRGQNSTCSGPPTVAEEKARARDCERSIPLLRRRRPTALFTKDFFRVGQIFSANAECSNTQWP